MKKIAILTSGGDAPGMNTCVHSVFLECIKNQMQLYGVQDGFQGLIDGHIHLLDEPTALRNANRGGTFLGTARSKQFLEPKYREIALQNLKSLGIEALIVIGGDGSYKGALSLYESFNFPVIGLPGTIDNDIPFTDYTIGFDTALNTIIEAVDKIQDTAQAHHRIFLVQVMGRNSGQLALNAGIACSADVVLIPEKVSDIHDFIQYVPKRSVKKSGLIIVAEGDEQAKLPNLRKVMEDQNPELDVRAIELGHIQRGGNPSYKDRYMAVRMGVKAVQELSLGVSGKMIAYREGKLVSLPLADIKNPTDSQYKMRNLMLNSLFSGEIL